MRANNQCQLSHYFFNILFTPGLRNWDEIDARSVVFCRILSILSIFYVGTVDYCRFCRYYRYLMKKVSISVVFVAIVGI